MIGTMSAERLALLLDSITVGIVVSDQAGRCTIVNRAAAEILGYRAEELIGKHYESILAGRGLPFEHSVTPMVDGDVIVGNVVTLVDIAPRLRLEAQLERAHRVDSLGRVAATMAHEFNNVLMGIQPFAEILLRNVSAEKRQMVEPHLRNSIQRGRKATMDILRFIQPIDPVRSAVDVEALLGTFAAEARSLLGGAAEIRVEVEGRPFVDADPNQLGPALTNLVLNARDAMNSKGRIVIGARREPSGVRFPFGVVEHPERYVHISFADSGAGIPPEAIDQIFEPFFTTKRNGSGLGLSIVHQIVKRHEGEIFVESVVGEGTTFHLFLPAAGDGTSASPLTVLVVEDEPTVAQGIALLLEDENMSVDVVESGAAAIETLQRKDFDVVVLDISLPDVDGRTVYDRILALRPTMPVIFSTGHAGRPRFEDVLKRPSTRMLLKPYEAADLLEAIREVTK